jgi:tetratricopeptide (TPR) repeat protein
MPNLSSTMEPTTADVADLYQQALAMAGNEEYEAALALLALARERAPDHIGLYLTTAQILAAELEDYPAALSMVERAGRLRPGAPMVACTGAEIDFLRGDFAAAEDSYRRLTTRSEVAALATSGLARTLLARARQLVERRRFDAAGRLLQESLGWEESAAAHLNLGICHHGMGQAQLAYQEYATAVELDPQNPLAYFQMGTLMADCQQIPQAAAAFAQTLTVDPGFPEARHQLASMQALLGNFEAAVSLLEVELAREPDCPRCHQLLSVAHLSQGNQAAALPHLEVAAAANPDDFIAHYNLGTLYIMLGRPGEAMAPLARARAIDPELFADRWREDDQFASVREREEFAALRTS